MSLRLLVWAVPAFLYAVFFFWYTSFGGPLTSEEVDQGGPTDWGQTNLNHGLPQASAPAKFEDAGTQLGMVSGASSLLVNESLETSEFISMLPYRTLFLHNHLGSPLSVGPRSDNTIIRRIVRSRRPYRGK